MKKVLIAYVSVKGHTLKIAEYMAEGVRISGNEPVLKKISEIKSVEDLKGYDGYLFGCPTYHRDMTQNFKTFLFMVKDANLEGKAGGAFGSYTHSGDAPKIIFDTLEHVFKMKVVNLGSLNIKEADIDKPEYIKSCHDYVKSLATIL